MHRGKAALLLLALAALFVLRLELLWHNESVQTIPQYIGSSERVIGTVASDPDVRDTSVRVNLAVESVGDAEGSGTLLAVLPAGSQVSYGDRLLVRGAIGAPQPFLTNTDRVFDYASYLRVGGVLAMMPKAQLLDSQPGGRSLKGSLYALKHAYEHSLERILPPEDAALLEGILLGERRGLPLALTQAFIISSLIHVVVLSGYNISIVAEATLRSLRFLPRTLGYGIGIVLMILFILMTGGGSTSLRAGVMALIAILARYVRRPAVAMRSLVIAAVLLALWNPLVVLYDPSFILSVLATFGLITLSPWVESHLPRFLSAHEQIKSITASTISVQIYVLPALLYYTGVLSFVAVPANLLALPLIPFAMLTGFIAGLLGFVHPLLGLLPALLSDLVLRWMMFVATSAANLPLSHTVIPPFSGWLLVALYIPLTLVAVRTYLRSSATLARRNALRVQSS
jgi:competence protein ComEC